jgi:purine nucleosidase
MENLKEKWIIDTDPGCDDMICLFYMLNRKDIDIEMISLIEGNTNIENVCINIKKILKIANRKDIKIFKGCKPIMKGCPTASIVHMADGMGNIEDLNKLNVDEYTISEGNSALKMVEIIERNPNKINILMIGPLTNIAIAYMISPGILDSIKSIYIMGGATNSEGNLLPSSEFNFSYDYIAPKIIFSKLKNTVLVPWDTTEKLIITKEDILKLKNENCTKETYKYVKQMINKMSFAYGGMKINDFYCSVCIFNREAVKNCYLAICEPIIDTEIMRGFLSIKSRKKSTNFIDGLSQMKLLNQKGIHLIVENIDFNIILKELDKIFS